MMNVKLTPEWLFRHPIDFEYNKYVALNYIKSSEGRLNDLKIYPDLHDITINLINIASISKENKTITLTRQLNEYDDEIVIGDFKYDQIPDLINKDKSEVSRTINFTYPKFLDLFNFAKSIWSLAFDNIDVKLKKNKAASSSSGYFYYFDKSKKLLYIYSYDIELEDGKYSSNSVFNEIYCGDYDNKISMIKVFDKLKDNKCDITKQVYEITSTQEFPVRETIIPIAKRKIIFKNINKL